MPLDYAQGPRLKTKNTHWVFFVFRCGLPRASFATAKRVEWRWGKSNPRAEGYSKEVYIHSSLFGKEPFELKNS